MSFSSDELNLLVWRYLVEEGFRHTAFNFANESNLPTATLESTNVQNGALVQIVQKGMYYAEAEACASSSNQDVDAERSAVNRFTLLEAVNQNLGTHRARTREKTEPVDESLSPKDLQQMQRDRDRENRANHHNGSIKKEVRQISPRNTNNGTLGLHAKKQQAAQQAQASSISNGEFFNNSRGDMDLNALHFPKECIRYLKCHSSEVFICAWNPKNDYMASGSGDATARIWDMTGSEDPSIPDSRFKNNKTLRHDTEVAENPHQNKAQDVTSLDWNNEGELLATGCYDGVARIWYKNGELKSRLGMHKGPIFALKWNSEGEYILSAGVDKTTIVWDARNGVQKQQFCFHSASALDVDWIDSKTFASCSTDKTIHISQLGCDKPIRSFLGHENEVNAIKYDSYSNRLASCSDDMTLRIWSLDQNTPVHTFRAHQKEIYTIRWNPKGYVLASASFDHTVRLWDVRQGDCIKTLTAHNDPVYSVAFSPDGRYLASGCFDRSVYIWDMHNGRVVQTYIGTKSQGGIFEVSWNCRGDKVAASASDGTVILMDVRQLKNKLF